MENFRPDPRTALDAVLPGPIKIGPGVKVYPLTLAHYAMLEKYGSYLIQNDHTPTQIEVIVTDYICTHEPFPVYKDFDKIEELAMEWAGSIPPSYASLIADAIKEQIDRMLQVTPPGDGKKKSES